jgi:hypothetical protein
MDTSAQGAPGYYVWEIPGKPVAVHLHLDVVDRLAAEAMRGFGAVPRRGAEVGGVLLGCIEPGAEPGNPAIVRIEDFDPVPCDYARGPSYLLASEDRRAFEEACARWPAEAARTAYAVGYFRSHTRDGLALSAEDIELLDRHFPAASHIALLIKPFATKASTAGFFFREGGVFQGATPLEFAFRRHELTGEEAPPPRPAIGRRPRAREMRTVVPAAVAANTDGESAAEPMGQSEPAYAVTTPARRRPRADQVWIPLSLLFLLLGVVLGFQAALSMGFKVSAPEALSLSLSVSKDGGHLSLKWDRRASAIRAARRGLLEIEDGRYTRSVDLDAGQLQNGGITYSNSSNTVRFKLVVYPNARLSVAETTEWRQ